MLTVQLTEKELGALCELVRQVTYQLEEDGPVELSWNPPLPLAIDILSAGRTLRKAQISP